MERVCLEALILLLFHFLCKTLYKSEYLNMTPPLAYLAHHFEYSKPTDSRKIGKAKCLRCENYDKAINTTREEQHLQRCLGYKAYKETAGKEEGNPNKRQRLLDESIPIRVTHERAARIDEQLAFCIYKSGKQFNLFEDDCWVKFFKDNFGYTPPSRKDLAGPLLIQAHKNMKEKVKLVLSSSSSLCVVTDESTNIANHRIINTSIVTESGVSIYHSNKEADEGKMGAKELAAHTVEEAKDITDGDLSKWTAVTSDTCTTMRAFGGVLGKTLEAAHVIPVLCDSHGLQLIIKDLLKLPTIKEIFEAASAIVGLFRHSSKQYAYLRSEQLKHYGKEKALIASIITRWGTQVNLAKSLENSKEALRSFAFREDTEFKYKAQLTSLEFWGHITELLELLELIHKKQKMSEANSANICYVYARWNEVESHLKEKANMGGVFAADLKTYLEGTQKKNWTRRRNKQVTDIHLAGHLLYPRNHNVEITPEQLTKLTKLFKRYTTNHEAALKQFLNFRKQKSHFGPNGIAWDYLDNPRLFWSIQETSCPELSSFAGILLTSIANSVPSERAFSTMNYIHSKMRNRLSVERADMLQYIYMNSRALDKMKDQTKHHHELTEADLIELENRYMEWV
jgi:hypothetical protein